MTVGSTKTLSMAAQIGCGVRKEDSHLVTDAETSALWDKLAAEHAQLKRDHPGQEIYVPNDPAF